MKPDRIIIGADHPEAELRCEKYMHRLIAIMIASSSWMCFRGVAPNNAANAMLATKISFINEIANLAERLGADIKSAHRHWFRSADRL